MRHATTASPKQTSHEGPPDMRDFLDDWLAFIVFALACTLSTAAIVAILLPA